MKHALSPIQSLGDGEFHVIEQWYLDALQEDMELRREINLLEQPP